MAEVRIGRLVRYCQRVHGLAADATRREMGNQRVAPWRAYGVRVIDVANSGQGAWRDHRQPGEQIIVPGRHALPSGNPLVEMAQLDPQDGRLQLVQALLVAYDLVQVLRVLAHVAQHFDAVVEAGVAGRDCAAVAVAAHHLGGVEAEAGDVAERSGRAAFVQGAVRMRGVFDHPQPVGASQLEQRVHVDGLAVEVDGKQRPGAWRDAFRNARDVHVEGDGIDINEDGCRAAVGDGKDGGDVGVGDGNDLIAGTDAAGQQRQMQRLGAVGDAQAVRGATVGGEFLLECAYLRPQRVATGGQHGSDGGCYLILDLLILARDVLGRDAQAGRRGHRRYHGLMITHCLPVVKERERARTSDTPGWPGTPCTPGA